MTRRAASLLILIALAISGGYAVATARNLNPPGFCQTVVSEKSDRVEAQPDVSAPTEIVVVAAVPEAPVLRSPHFDPRYQRPPPSR